MQLYADLAAEGGPLSATARVVPLRHPPLRAYRRALHAYAVVLRRLNRLPEAAEKLAELLKLDALMDVLRFRELVL